MPNILNSITETRVIAEAKRLGYDYTDEDFEELFKFLESDVWVRETIAAALKAYRMTVYPQQRDCVVLSGRN